MSRNDVRLKDAGGQNTQVTWTWQVASQASVPLIKAGEFAIQTSAGSPYAILMTDTLPVTNSTTGTGTLWLGLAVKDSTETASVDGTVELLIPNPNHVYAAIAKTATDVNTAAKILALQGDRVVMDLTAAKITVDVSAGDAAGNGLVVVGGDPSKSEVWFMVRNAATILE
jgi:hypothetical protein